MPPSEPDRPTPESLLGEAQREGRGKLKVFLGASPGVGKTFTMLEQALIQKRAGVDVVAALVETHGRAETADLLAPLEVLPRRTIDYRGQILTEMDIDGLLARRPQLALIDELAHSNVPGSRHPKRWQDVIEVIDAGIDVVTTLNVQHIESLNDVVARITGVRVQETVPDEILKRADEIELIDLPPEELIGRLRDGKVYVAHQVGRALENFFSKGNLTALRELALRTAASRVDDQMLNLMQASAVKGPWPTQERLLVCINESPMSKPLIRAAKRMADRAKIPWIAATVVTPAHEALGAASQHARTEALRLAEELGAETATLHAESNAARELLAFARARNVTRLVIGRPRARFPFGYLREAVADKLLDAATDFEVTVVAAQPERAPRRRLPQVPLDRQGYAAATAATVIATALAWPIDHYGIAHVGTLSVIYLAGILLVAARYGLWPSIAASLMSFLAYDFFFTAPRLTFNVSSVEDVAAIVVYLLGAIFTGTLAGRLKAQVQSMRAAQKRTETLYDFARKIASVSTADDVLWAAAYHIAATLYCRSLILMPNAAGELEQVQGHPTIEEIDARAEGAARWAYEKNEPAGAGTMTLPTSDWLFVPMATASGPLGVIGVQFRDPGRSLDPETKRLLLAVENQVAVAVERVRLASDLEASRVKAESENLRTALLNSVSHDLRTPLVSVIGAVTGLLDSDSRLSAEDRHELTVTALDEARRLDRYVQNLLDMTRLGYGALAPHRAAVDLREIIGRARADLERALSAHSVVVDLPRDLPRVNVDPVLIGQAVVNVLENASKYAPRGTTIAISGRADRDFVVLDIADEGDGIPADAREKVFDLFYRVKLGDTQPSGTGLGLAIVRGLVEAHGGTVKALPGPRDKGTMIEIRLPAAAAEAVPEAAQ